MDLDLRIRAYRFVAYSAVAFSVIAVLSICITLPMVYNYLHHVKGELNKDLDACSVGDPYLFIIPHYKEFISWDETSVYDKNSLGSSEQPEEQRPTESYNPTEHCWRGLRGLLPSRTTRATWSTGKAR